MFFCWLLLFSIWQNKGFSSTQRTQGWGCFETKPDDHQYLLIWYVVYWSSKRVETTKHHQTIAGELSCALPLFLYFSLFLSLSLAHRRWEPFQDIGMQSMQKLVESASAIGSCWGPQSTFQSDQVLAKTRYCNLRKRPHAPLNQLFPWFSTNQTPWALVFFPCFWRPQPQQGKHPPAQVQAS